MPLSSHGAEHECVDDEGFPLHAARDAVPVAPEAGPVVVGDESGQDGVVGARVGEVDLAFVEEADEAPEGVVAEVRTRGGVGGGDLSKALDERREDGFVEDVEVAEIHVREDIHDSGYILDGQVWRVIRR